MLCEIDIYCIKKQEKSPSFVVGPELILIELIASIGCVYVFPSNDLVNYILWLKDYPIRL